MITIKLVVIGASGVGKTSLRSKYIDGRFSNGYRATIGADFITKVLPHPTDPEETVMLQIWDTAGQERFSSLSSAFFRGADAAILMYDVNQPETLEALTRWWSEFRTQAPLADEDMEDYCCVVVGNKTDLVAEHGQDSGIDPVTKDEARAFLRQIVPPGLDAESSVSDIPASDDDDDDDNLAASTHTIRPSSSFENGRHLDLSTPPDSPNGDPSPSQSRRPPIAIMQPNGAAHAQRTSVQGLSPKHHLTKSRSRSSSRYYTGTMTSTHTTLTVYHTPSSSMFDTDSFRPARSSPEPFHPSASTSPDTDGSVRARRMTNGSASSGSAITMTPSLFARERAANGSATPEPPQESSANGEPDRGPKLFLTSAKTGENVSAVFEYIARRVVGRWEWNERVESRKLHMRDASTADTIRLGLQGGHKSRKEGGLFGNCC